MGVAEPDGYAGAFPAKVDRGRVDGWDEPRELSAEQREEFLEFIRENRGISIQAACRQLGLRRRDVRALRRSDSEFEEDYRNAQGYGPEKVLNTIVEEAIDGHMVPLVSAGKVVRDDNGDILYEHKRSEKLLALMYQSLTPEGKLMLGNKIGIELHTDGGDVKVQQGVSLQDVAKVLQDAGALPTVAAGEIIAEEDEPVG